MSSLKEQYTKFLQIEEELDLFNRRIDGIPYWDLSRVEIFFELFEGKSSGSAKTKIRLIWLKKLLFYVRSLFNLPKNPLLCSAKDIVFSGGQRRVQVEDGTWWDIHVDPLLGNINVSYMSLEYPINLEHYGPAKTPILYYFDVLITLGFIRRMLGLTKVKLRTEDLRFLESVREELKTRFEVDVDVTKIVIGRLHERQSLLPLCLKFLKRVKPKLVVMVTSYARKSLLEACRILNITTIELQHGVISSYHPGYSFPNSARHNVLFPDYLMVFGEYWRTIADYPIEEDHIISVGYPFLEKRIKLHTQAKRKRQIVFISQNRFGVPISRMAVELSKVSDFDYRIVYKLHPREVLDWKARYPWLVDANVEVIDTLGTGLFKLLGESMVQVGVSSTAIYEGLAFGLRTFILDVPGSEYFQPLLDAGQAHKVTSVSDFVKQLRDEENVVHPDIDYIFSRNGVTTTIEYIKRFLEKCDSTRPHDL